MPGLLAGIGSGATLHAPAMPAVCHFPASSRLFRVGKNLIGRDEAEIVQYHDFVLIRRDRAGRA